MAVYVDWPNRIIHVPRADLPLVQLIPSEIRDMNLNWFRMQLKGLESEPIGMQFPDTHRHNTEVTLSGLTFARVIEIINDYTVTFEDGQYAVNLTGANSNVGDRVNVNQVSVRSANSAGMTSSPAIEYASFNGGVTLNMLSPFSGTVYPIGTPQQPVNNLVDAMLIARFRGFTAIYVNGDAVIDSGDYRDMMFVGDSKTKTQLHVSEEAQVDRCEFYEATINGVLDGDSTLKGCVIGTLDYVSGFVEQCVLSDETILLGRGAVAHFLDCWSGVPGSGTPTIDMGGVGQSLAMRNYNGGILIRNKTGPEKVSIDLNSGQVKIDLATVTAGEIVVRGVGKVINSVNNQALLTGQYGDLTLLVEVMSKENIADTVYSVVGKEIEYASYNGGVTIDAVNGTDSSEYPYGTSAFPCKTPANSYAIRISRGINRVFVRSDLLLTGIPDGVLVNLRLQSLCGPRIRTVTFDGVLVTSCIGENIIVTGIPKLGSTARVIDCLVDDLHNTILEAFDSYIVGGHYLGTELTRCQITGLIQIDSGGYFSGIDVVAEGDDTIIDLKGFNNVTVSLDVSSGIITFINAVEGSLIELNLRGGEIVLDASCTGGNFYAEGYGTLYNDSNMNITENHLLALETIPDPVWKYERT